MKKTGKMRLTAAELKAATATLEAGGYIGSGGVFAHQAGTAAPPSDPPHIATKRANLRRLLGELDAGQKEMQAGTITQQRGEELEGKAQEAEALQAEVDRYDRISGLAAKGREVEDPTLPPGTGTGADRLKGSVNPGVEVVGYLSVGRMFTASKAYTNYIDAGLPQQMGDPFGFKSFDGEDRFVALTRDDYQRLTAKMDAKAIATINAGVIQPQRIAEVVRDSEMRQLMMSDLFNHQQTDSNAVEYVVTIPPAAHAAAPVAEGAVKPETTTELDTATATVRTIAVHMPVTEQQLADIPQVQGIIDTELRYELDLEEEEQLTWADGTGQNLLGVFQTPGVLAGRAVAGDTLLDKIRRAITDVAVARLQANGVVLHPYDSEVLDLLKGTDSHYVWAVVTDSQGNQRVWGLRKVESVAMQKPTIGGGNTVYERRVLVGDFIRGATVWDRQMAAVAVGWINAQFIENKRTIRAEKRIAFGVKRPRGFRYVVAQAEAA